MLLVVTRFANTSTSSGLLMCPPTRPMALRGVGAVGGEPQVCGDLGLRIDVPTIVRKRALQRRGSGASRQRPGGSSNVSRHVVV